MKLRLFVYSCLAVASIAAGPGPRPENSPAQDGGKAPGEKTKLVRITATVDGTGRIICTRDGARYEHKQWGPPRNVVFDGVPWSNLSQTPDSWSEMVGSLDLTRARIIERKGRDTIALESTPDGFDLYLCDSVNGSAPYEVTVAIPRRAD